MSRSPAYEYYTLTIPADCELYCAIQEETQRTGESPSIVARAMLNKYIQQRDMLVISESRLQQIKEQALKGVAIIDDNIPDAPLNTNADEALEPVRNSTSKAR